MGPPPFVKKIPKKSHFFLIRKFWIRRDPPPPLSEFFWKKPVFFFDASPKPESGGDEEVQKDKVHLHHRGMGGKEICNSLKVFARRQEINGREIVWNWNLSEQGTLARMIVRIWRRLLSFHLPFRASIQQIMNIGSVQNLPEYDEKAITAPAHTCHICI